MKTLFALALLLPLFAHAEASDLDTDLEHMNDADEAQTCTAEVLYPNNEWRMYKVECDNDYAGKCLKQLDANHGFELEETACTFGE